MKYKNMKIAITDETHLKDVCSMLEGMGYIWYGYTPSDGVRFIYCYANGYYHKLNIDESCSIVILVTLPDLLKMRDEMVKNENT